MELEVEWKVKKPKKKKLHGIGKESGKGSRNGNVTS